MDKFGLFVLRDGHCSGFKGSFFFFQIRMRGTVCGGVQRRKDLGGSLRYACIPAERRSRSRGCMLIKD